MPRKHVHDKSADPQPAVEAGNRASTTSTVRRRAVRFGLLMLVLAALIWQRDRWLPQLVHWRVQSALQVREPEVALQWLDRLEWCVEDDPQAAFLRARAHRKLGQLDEVRLWLQEALDRGVARDLVEREEWLACAQAGQLQQAEPHLQELLLTAGDDLPEVCDAYVAGYMRTGRDPQALAILESWIADYPHDPWPVYLKGHILLNQGRYTEAEQQFLSVLQLDPDDSRAALDLGEVLLIQQQLDRALEQFLSAASDPDCADAARVGAATAYESLGRPGEASRLFREVVRDDPDNVPALRALGRLELDAGRLPEAVRLLETAVEQDPRSVSTRYLFGQALQQSGRIEEAATQTEWIESARKAQTEIRNLRDELANTPDDAELRFRVASLEYEFGSRDESILTFTSVLDLDPSHGPTHAALARHYRELADDDPAYRDIAERHARQAELARVPIE